MASDEMVVVENVNCPGKTSRVRADKYRAMRVALLKALPRKAPGLTQDEMGTAVLEFLPESLFPGGEKALWWLKTVQLDLEAKELVVRNSASRPTRWRRV